MGEYLPGTLQERLREIRERNKYGMNDVADKIGIDRTTYSRIERGITKTISSDILVRLSQLYDVPTDYILGLSDTPEKTWIEIKDLGLSVEAAKNLYSKKVNPDVVNELLISDKFATATRMLATYFTGYIARGLAMHNQLLDFSYGLTTGCMLDLNIKSDKEMIELKRELMAKKVPAQRYEITRIQDQLMASVKEIQKKFSDEIKLVSENEEKLNGEIIENIKRDVFETPGIKDLPYEKKKEIVIQSVKNEVIRGIDLPDDKIEILLGLIDQTMSGLMDLWKKD